MCDAKLLLKEYGVFNIKPSQRILPMYDCHSTLHDGWGEGNNIARPVMCHYKMQAAMFTVFKPFMHS